MIQFQDLQDTAIRRGKVGAVDSQAKAGIASDLNIAQQIVAGLRFWEELMKRGSLSVVQGTDTYDLASDVDDIEQILITSPSGLVTEVEFVNRTELRRRWPLPANAGQSTPYMAYLAEPSVNAGTATKQLTFFPEPNQAYTVQYSYRRIVGNMTLPTDYPFFNQKYHHILIDYALWKEAETNPDESKNPNYYRELWGGPMYPERIGGGLGELLGATVSQQVKTPVSIPGPDRA